MRGMFCPESREIDYLESEEVLCVGKLNEGFGIVV